MTATIPRTSPLRVSEKAFMQSVIDYARRLGYRVYHTHDSRRSEPGFPDLVICGHGRVLYRELKREGGRLTWEQREWLDALSQAGADARCWWPSSFSAIEKELAR